MYPLSGCVPHRALEAPYRVNASKCLSYLTIEKKDGIHRETGRKMGRCFFGCDICQEACPHNRGKESAVVTLPSLTAILHMRDADFEGLLGKTALARAGLEKIKGNIAALMGNQTNHAKLATDPHRQTQTRTEKI